ncbi:hypothetical protein [Candidatus Albibeggiatoa sp. nov. BB20]|uniref:hypothetical protein n=1 Tax=Candidatus Albibeggiatoa sp. nov. BB20 TaxID=3162723 RepID=UPI003365AEED
MKYLVGGITIIISCLIAGIFGILLLFPNSIVTNQYATLEAARTDHLFGRGWLPNILPPSAYDIHTSNNLDINISDGKFSFSPSEYMLFASRTRQYIVVNTPFVNWEKTVARRRKKGFQPTIYAEESTRWVFFCKVSEGYCEYVMHHVDE